MRNAKSKWCVNSGDEEGAFGARNDEAHKIDFEIPGLEWRWDRGLSSDCRANFFIFLFYDTCVRYTTMEWVEGERRLRRDIKRRRKRGIDKRCKVPFVMVSYSIYHDQFRDLSIVSEFTVPREIGTLRKNVMCTHIRRRSSRTSRRRVRSRLDSLLGRW